MGKTEIMSNEAIKVKEFSEKIAVIKNELNKDIVGQEDGI